jgi:23S rRNA (guanosine2251-2'-O)-methyltransferase
MKPPQHNRPGNRNPGGGAPRKPGGPGDGQERGRGAGPRPHGGGFHQGGGPRPAQGEAPRGKPYRGPRPDDQRPRDDSPTRLHVARPARSSDQAGLRRFDARPDQRGDRPQGSQQPGPRRDSAPAPRPEFRAPEARPSPDAPRGTVWLYGMHAVAAALVNPARRLRRLLLTEEAEAALSGRLKQPWPLTQERVERGRLEHLLGRDVVHQGAALLADLLTTPGLAHVLERPGPVIVLDQVSDPRNVGAILRSVQAFGGAVVIVQERNAPDETGALAKAASGALEKVPLLRAVNLARTLVALKAAGCWVVGLDSGGAPLSGPALAQRRVALVLGSEGEGLRRLTRETCDEVAGIAMPGSGGGLDSLNVSAAAAVALYELGRRA